jgi:hypothetical protein
MSDLRQDPIINVIQNGIKRGIRVALENDCYPSAVILIYSGIDTMAFLNMPANQLDVTRPDFIEWAERYIRFPCQEQLSGLDLYGTRCSMLHTHSAFSRLSREGRCRMIGYMDQSVPEVIYNPDVDRELVMVSIQGLAEAFLSGVDQFLIDLFANPEKARLAEERFRLLVHTIDYDPSADNATTPA